MYRVCREQIQSWGGGFSKKKFYMSQYVAEKKKKEPGKGSGVCRGSNQNEIFFFYLKRAEIPKRGIDGFQKPKATSQRSFGGHGQRTIYIRVKKGVEVD